MNNECNIIKDLLPLYADNVCSSESKQLVDNHIAECQDCKAILRKLSDTGIETILKEEGDNVVQKHAQKEKRKSFTVGMVFSGILMIPIVVCLIVDLATGHGLSWFFIVLASILVLASLLIVPLMVHEKKGMWTMLAFAGSLILLFATICIITKGKWFFLVTVCVLFGLSFILAPLLSKLFTNGFWSKHRGLFIIGTITIMFLLMMCVIGLYASSMKYWSIMFAIVFYNLIYVWGMFGIIRYLPVAKGVRAGLATILSGLFASCSQNIIFMLLGYSVVWHPIYPLTWNGSTINSNVNWVVFVICLVIGTILIVTNIGKRSEEKK